MNEKIKHRIVGVVVIAAFLVIIVPALIKHIAWNDDAALTSQANMIPALPLPDAQPPEMYQTSLLQPIVWKAVPEVAPLPPLPVPVPEPAPKPVIEAPKPVIKKVIAKPKPAVVKKVVQKPKPAAKPVAMANKTTWATLCVQAGVFSNPDNAKLVVDRLKARGFTTANIESVKLPNGKTGQRVKVCKPMSRAEAMIMRAKIARLMRAPVIIVKQGE